MQGYLILHGHFYQPPRENPWTDLIPRQPSAHPFHDWNKRITQECYGANCNSRYLGGYGEVLDISNNYEIFSFNFGPTLMNWLKEEGPYVYHKIIEADKTSQKLNNGHGNAIAQVYNHIIMPLATPDERKIQIHWGIEDFKSHFKRMPEGMWLAETAINQDTVDDLIEAGIRFVILSPWQAESVEDETTGKMKKVTDPLDVSHCAYWLEGSKGGRIAAFFYNHVLAQGISFGHYLQNADDFYNKLSYFAERAPHNLIHTATDGEIYGHHEAYADMCISALRKKIEMDGDKAPFRFTNYANILDINPPQLKATLQKGEAGKGSSWSCFHGVSRWYKDCGCSTGGPSEWNQKWRTHVRNAFDLLRQRAEIIFHQQVSKLTHEEPLEIAKNYIQLLCNQTTPEKWAQKFLKKDTAENRIKLLTLLEGFKYLQFMYTSCGWFFAELSGIEPVQNMCYAARAAEIFQKYTHEDLTKILCSQLSQARSNIPEQGNGEEIFNRYVKTQEYSIERLASINILLHHFKLKTVRSNGFTTLKIKRRSIVIKKDSTTEIFTLRYRVEMKKNRFTLFIYHEGKTYEMSHLFFDEYLEDHHVRSLLKECIPYIEKTNGKFIKHFSVLEAISPSTLFHSISTILFYRLLFLCVYKGHYKDRIAEMMHIFDTHWMKKTSSNEGLSCELEKDLHMFLNTELEAIMKQKDACRVEQFIQLIENIDRSSIALNKAFLQNFIFNLERPQFLDEKIYQKLKIVLGLSC